MPSSWQSLPARRHTRIVSGSLSILPHGGGAGDGARGSGLAAGRHADRFAEPYARRRRQVHLAYEMVLLNMAPGVIGLKKIETLDVGSGAALGTLEGNGLVKMLSV
jgi:hypothetical protein